MTKKSDAPAIRFKGFSDAWEQRKVSDLAEKTYGGGTPTTSNEAYWNGDIPWIQSSDVVDGKLLGVEPRKWITQDGLNNSAAQLIPGNSIAIITRVGVGKLAFMPYSYATSQDFLSLSKLNAEPLFTVYACYKKLQSELNAVQGTSIKGITKDELLAKNIMVPRYAEQQQIGAFFKQLDNLITLHQRKCVFLFGFFQAFISMIFTASTFSWEQRKLGDIADIVGGGTPSTGNQSYWDGDIDWYAPAEIADQIYANSSQKKITGLGYENSSAKMLPPGTVLFTSRAGIGKTAILTRKGCTNQGFQSIVPHRGELDSYFIFSRTEELKRYGELVGAGSTFVEVSGKQMAVMELMMPPTMREQQTIGGFFQQLDNLITLHQRKFEKLTNVKKSMLEKMFPQNGSSYPEIRFKGFTDPWEQRKLGELVDRVVRKNINNESTLPLTISAQYGLVDQITYFNNRVASRDVSNYYLVLNGEFAYNKSTSDGYPFGAVKRLDLYEKGVLSTLYIVFAPKKEQQIDSDYLTVFFDTDRWHKGVAERAAEGARNHGLLNISAEDFFDIDLSVPKDIVEQKQIGAFIRQLDNLITLHQRELEKLQNIKKSMLEKMFV